MCIYCKVVWHSTESAENKRGKRSKTQTYSLQSTAPSSTRDHDDTAQHSATSTRLCIVLQENRSSPPLSPQSASLDDRHYQPVDNWASHTLDRESIALSSGPIGQDRIECAFRHERTRLPVVRREMGPSPAAILACPCGAPHRCFLHCREDGGYWRIEGTSSGRCLDSRNHQRDG